MNIWQDFITNKSNPIGKHTHYFPIYERHMSAWRNKSLTFLEIGVAGGGSLQMWQRYFGPFAKVIGIDINPECKAHERPGIFVRIGDQSDPAFLQSLIDEFGIPDVVLDDGSHQMVHLFQTFSFLYPRMPKNAIYMIEDLHTSYFENYGGGLEQPASFINLSKAFIDRLYADYIPHKLPPDIITRQTLGISFYDSIVCFEKGDVWWKQILVAGADGIEPVGQTLYKPAPVIP